MMHKIFSCTTVKEAQEKKGCHHTSELCCLYNTKVSSAVVIRRKISNSPQIINIFKVQ